MKKSVKGLGILLSLFMVLTMLSACVQVEIVSPEAPENNTQTQTQTQNQTASVFSPDSIPEYSGDAYVAVNNNIPFFTKEDMTTSSFEEYSELDRLGRCGVAYSCVGEDLMPTEKRGNISQVKPTGWQVAKYDFVDGKYLYNRCHLIGFQLTAENANDRNLITGTRYFNTIGMLPFENMVADYIKETGNHVMYRVTPVFEGKDLVARGALMEGWSVEDEGDGVCFCVYAYNVQPGVIIDYATGDNRKDDGQKHDSQESKYVLNTSSKKFHKPTCSGVDKINPDNRQDFTGYREDLIAQGYAPCGNCKP